jgi:hypothetical protein
MWRGDGHEDVEGGMEQSRVVKGKERKKSLGDKVKSFVFGAGGVTKEWMQT